MIKKRSDEINKRSEGFITIFFSKWACNKLHNDYGLDYHIIIFENQITTKYSFCIQLKATDSLKIKDKYIKVEIDIRHLAYWCDFIDPVLFIIYDVANNTGYYLDIYKYCTLTLDKEKPEWRIQKNIWLNIPLTNKLTSLDQIKIDMIETTKIKLRFETHSLKWYEGYESILNDPEKLEKIIEKKEFDNIKMRLLSGELFFRQNDLQKVIEQFQKVYNLKKEDENHLKAILGFVLSHNIIMDDYNNQVSNLCSEGINLAEKLKNNLYIETFDFFLKLFVYIKLLNEQLMIFGVRQQFINSNSYDSFIRAFDNVRLNRLEKIL